MKNQHNHRKNKLLDGFDGKLQMSKWAKTTKSSTDTALLNIKDLVEKGFFKPKKKADEMQIMSWLTIKKYNSRLFAYRALQ